MVAANHSRKVHSSQAGIHLRLGELLARYRDTAWHDPMHAPTVEACQSLKTLLGTIDLPLVLDSGCGTGESTRRLASLFPDSLVIGVDKSADRLSRGGLSRLPCREDNAVWVRGELATFWRFALREGWRLKRHYLLYPNPWPKPGQVQRRWHAHPVFRDLLQLGGRLEMRTNWETYAEEFAFAVNFVKGSDVVPVLLPPSGPLSPFERKYQASGHRLYSVVSPM